LLKFRRVGEEFSKFTKIFPRNSKEGFSGSLDKISRKKSPLDRGKFVEREYISPHAFVEGTRTGREEAMQKRKGPFEREIQRNGLVLKAVWRKNRVRKEEKGWGGGRGPSLRKKKDLTISLLRLGKKKGEEPSDKDLCWEEGNLAPARKERGG